MEDRKEKMAALCMLIALVDDNNGKIEVNTSKILSIYNDEDEVVRAKLASGEIVALADMDYEPLNDAIIEWRDNNPNKFDATIEKMKKQL